MTSEAGTQVFVLCLEVCALSVPFSRLLGIKDGVKKESQTAKHEDLREGE
jgi:hypothetical protein